MRFRSTGGNLVTGTNHHVGFPGRNGEVFRQPHLRDVTREGKRAPPAGAGWSITLAWVEFPP